MSVDFVATGLDGGQFAHFFEADCSSHGVQICVVDEANSYPCRVSLVDAEIGETVALLPFMHHDVVGPYRASGPIFVRQGSVGAMLGVNEVPDVMVRRLLSFRAYDSAGFMVDCEVAQGSETRAVVERLFGTPEASYIHVHNARPGCYSCRIDRAPG